MTIKVAIQHETTYRFDRLVRIMPHEVRLRPAPHSRTPIESYSLKVEPSDHYINWQQDPFANYLARLVFTEKARMLKFKVELIANMTVINPFDFFLDEEMETFPFKYDKQLRKDLAPYLQVKEKGPLLMDWLKQVKRRKRPTNDFLVDLNQRLQGDIAYLIRMEAGVQTCEQTLQNRSGSCRDSAWLLVQILRHLGLAARFVSGYLVQLVADQKALDGPSGTDKDFTDLHAWAEVYIPGAGWVGLDPTSGLLAAEGHIPLACTPDPVSAAPITGATDTCEVDFSFSNEVSRIYEDPRVTKPFSESEWHNINALGQRIDKKLEADDVRLTMGGEPTFVSIDDMDGAQWNTDALGKDKLKLAGRLLLRLKEQFAPDSVLYHGQGKWYPGEELPRWAMGFFWRTDGKPIWHNQKLLDIPDSDTEITGNKPKPRAFLKALCEKLGINSRYIVPGYEDKAFYIKREGQLPKNRKLSQLEDEQERKRLLKVFDQGLDSQRGFALPLTWSDDEETSDYLKSGWLTSRWSFRRSKMILIPGDSPMGYRLPLESLPWERNRDIDPERDPFDEKLALGYPTPSPDIAGPPPAKADQRVVEKIIHTALCVEARDEQLYIFMPPLHHLEQYLHLLGCVDQVANSLQQPVIIEGYEPPTDPRLKKLMLTPDPGVIEVNIHPSSTWQEFVSKTEVLYEAARLSRLGTEKFMLDGKHTGTGGGNHITLGGPRPEDSPFFRHPQLLPSMLRFWQNHPCLSYLFSGQFVGPTSQAPRVDEARDDTLYELSIALQQIPDDAGKRPWLIDRILRNFLTDLTGNTHRAEFCIDKLYSPDSARGRLGLVEFRNFEMPPHWQMSVVQALLLRALISWFWEKPYTRDFIPWGTQLHDRFMLPHYIWQDLDRVIRGLNEAGYPLELNWFRTFHEFRFPRYGGFHTAGVQVDLYSAIEPWHVLGEENRSQGTARYVDSSVERLQVKVQGLSGQRLALCCNGRKLPLQATGREGEYVAGVRYKAWEPWSALHPTIKVHTPLVFDLVDTANQHSLGGCTYHVAHPGGRNPETFPVNANEAEARRNARFSTHGHTQGRINIRDEVPHPQCPTTLDLRTAH